MNAIIIPNSFISCDILTKVVLWKYSRKNFQLPPKQEFMDLVKYFITYNMMKSVVILQKYITYVHTHM